MALTDAQLLQQAEIIKNETIEGANTAPRIGSFVEDMINSKVSILAPKLSASSTVGYVWTATDAFGNGSWQAGGGGGSVGGNPSGIQVNVAGAFGAFSNFTYLNIPNPKLTILNTIIEDDGSTRIRTKDAGISNPIQIYSGNASAGSSGGISIITGIGSVASGAITLGVGSGDGEIDINDSQIMLSVSDITFEMLGTLTGRAVFTDTTTTPKGIQYAGTGYVTQLHSLTDKEWVINNALVSVAGNVAFPGTWTIGALSYSDTGILWSAQSSTNSYNQAILQNTSNGATASTNFNVSNNNGTSSTNFGEFGINSSGFTGSGAFSTAGYVYLASASTDLAIGTYASNAIHFVINSGVSDAMTISSKQNFTFNQLDQSSGWAPTFTINPGVNTALTATAEFIDYDFKGRSVTWNDGTVATQRFAYFRGNTVNKTTTSATFTNIYTAYFDQSIAGSGVTFTNNYAIGASGSIVINGGTNTGFFGASGISTNFRIGTLTGTGIASQYISSGSTFMAVNSANSQILFTTQQIAFTQTSINGALPMMVLTAGAPTSLTTATEYTDINFNLSAVAKIVDGTVATQRAFRIQGRTYTPQTTALTLTEASTLEVTPPIAGSGTTITTNYAIKSTGNIGLIAANLLTDTTTGMKIGGSASQKLGIYGATPIVQPTTAIAASTFVANTSGTLNDTATWDGYTHGQVVKALRNIGILA